MKRIKANLIAGVLLATLALAATTQAQEYTFTTLAGLAGSSGMADGTASAARFDGPQSVAVDSARNVYVADTGNSTIRKVTPGGVVTTLAGLAGSSGSADGTASAARFDGPQSVAVDSARNVYVADTGNSTIRKVTPGGVVTTLAGLAGSWGGTNDGTGSAARFNGPQGVAVDSAGNLYVADTYNSTIRKVTPGGVVTTLAGLAAFTRWGSPIVGSADGTGSAAQFNYPSGVAVDSAGNVYMTDRGNATLRKVTPGGVVTTLAGVAGNPGSADGTGSAAQFNYPSGVAVDSAGNLYVADTYNSTIRTVTPGGVVTTLTRAGSAGSADGTGSVAQFLFPWGVAVDSAGSLYVADEDDETIRIGTTNTCADAPTIDLAVGPVGQLRQLDTSPQTAVAWQWSLIRRPAGSVASLSAPNIRNPTFTPDVPDLYVFQLDATNAARAICIRRLAFSATAEATPQYTFTTLAGPPEAGPGTIDGTGSAARFNNPQSVAVDSAGNVYVADYNNHTIRKVTPDGLVTTLAGLAGSSGTNDGMGSAGRFNYPAGVAVDSAGNVYVADANNCAIRKVTPGGVVTTLAGLAAFDPWGNPVGGSADGTGSAARFNDPAGVAVDSAGNLYVADRGNATIRKVTPGGVVTTLAGLAGSSGSADGTGSAARFQRPCGVAVDSTGNVYVADYYNYTIRKVTPGRVVTTLAGEAGSYGSADGTGSAARFNNPSGVAVDSVGNLYVADSANDTIRKVTPDGVVTTLAGKVSFNTAR